MALIEQLKYKFKTGDVSIKLIFICVGVFLLDSILRLFNFHISGLFSVGAGMDGFFYQPWGILTYVFFHGNLLHLALNMFMLFVAGKFFLRYFRDKDLLTFYFFGAICGGILFALYSTWLGDNPASLVGASAAVYSVFFALVSYVPKMKVQLAIVNIKLPLDYLAYGLLAFDLLMILAGNNDGGHVSHLGGAAFGFFYMKQFEKGNDFLGKLGMVFSAFGKKTEKKTASRPKPPRDDYEFNSRKVEKQKKVDGILDKISRSGYESLSKDEKDFLFKSGRNG